MVASDGCFGQLEAHQRIPYAVGRKPSEGRKRPALSSPSHHHRLPDSPNPPTRIAALMSPRFFSSVLLPATVPALVVAASLCAPTARAAEVAPESFEVGGLKFKRPADWTWVPLQSSSMRKAQLAVPGLGAAKGAEITFFHFGPSGGGDLESNIQRWIRQFQSAPRCREGGVQDAWRQEDHIGDHRRHLFRRHARAVGNSDGKLRALGRNRRGSRGQRVCENDRPARNGSVREAQIHRIS